jgi:hypothetical protein
MKDPLVAALLAWLIPGAGHWYVGQRSKALAFCILLTGLFVTGVWLTAGACVDLGRHRYAFLLQAFEGVLAIGTLLLTRAAHEPPASRLSDLGMLLTLVAGALNVLLIADALYRARPVPGDEEAAGAKKEAKV